MAAAAGTDAAREGGRTGGMWLVGYICLNLMTTLLNKWIMNKLDFPFPMSLSLLHYTCSSFGSLCLIHGFKYITPAKLDSVAHRKLFAFSVLFNINILLSIVSLHMVSMALHQIIRALVPAFTVVIAFFLLRKTYGAEILAALGIIFLGVTIYASKGEVAYTMLGLVLTIVGAFLAALKGVLTNLFMVGPLKLNPLDLLQYMSTYASLQLLVYLFFEGSLQETVTHLQKKGTPTLFGFLAVNGFGAFSLNVVSFNANKKTSPLAMNIGGITKQVLAILIGIFVFRTPITSLSAIGVLVTIVGIIWYATANFRAKQKAQLASKPAASSGGSKA